MDGVNEPCMHTSHERVVPNTVGPQLMADVSAWVVVHAVAAF